MLEFETVDQASDTRSRAARWPAVRGNALQVLSIVLFLALGVAFKFHLKECGKLPPGSYINIKENTWGTSDMDSALAAAERVLVLNDVLGAKDLGESGKLFRVRKDTWGLVLDTHFRLKNRTHYRLVRIYGDQLGGAYVGRAYWVRKDALSPSSQRLSGDPLPKR